MTRMRSLLAGVLVAAAAPLAAQPANIPVPPRASHPPEVALMDEGTLGSVYRQTANSLRLYTSDKDPPGQSACNGGCAMAWQPVRAKVDAEPVGDWTIVKRLDGTRQWALKGKPVYVRFHDSPDQPTGEGIPGWRLVPYTQAAGTPGGVTPPR